jgi:hypothetical protein
VLFRSPPTLKRAGPIRSTDGYMPVTPAIPCSSRTSRCRAIDSGVRRNMCALCRANHLSGRFPKAWSRKRSSSSNSFGLQGWSTTEFTVSIRRLNERNQIGNEGVGRFDSEGQYRSSLSRHVQRTHQLRCGSHTPPLRAAAHELFWPPRRDRAALCQAQRDKERKSVAGAHTSVACGRTVFRSFCQTAPWLEEGYPCA